MADRSMDGLNTFTAEEGKTVIDNKKRVRIGFIGTGGIANSHIKAYLNRPDVDIVAGCDLVEGRAEAFFKKYGLEGVKTDYASHVEMLADTSLELDAVSICTYNRQHAPCAIAAMRAGLDVLLEKPFTVTLDEAIECMRVEKETGAILSIGFQPRFDPNMQMIKKIVESGELGRIYYIQTGGGRRRGIPARRHDTFIRNDTAGVGALGDIGCYSIDMIMNALGHPTPLTATGFVSSYFGKDPNYCGYAPEVAQKYAESFGVDDFAGGFIRLEGDIILDFRISWAMNMDTPGDTIILGTKGGLKIPSTECWNGTVGGPMKIFREVDGLQTELEIPIINKKVDRVGEKIASFVEAVKTRGQAPVPTSQIVKNQAIIDALARSAALGHEVEIVIPEI